MCRPDFNGHDEFCLCATELGSAAKHSGPAEIEHDAHKLEQRQKQIDYGKNTLGYATYCSSVSRCYTLISSACHQTACPVALSEQLHLRSPLRTSHSCRMANEMGTREQGR
jgi:hypothetical protein